MRGGEVLGNRYKIMRELGSGGMAWVYLAEDTLEHRLVAVKVLYPQFSEDVSYIQRFTREAKLASGLSDVHIVRVLDYGASRDVHYLVMEHIEGHDLREIIDQRAPLPYQEVLDIAAQVCQALEHASMYGIVHRDIKPQNLMITEDGTVKVLDFGIARANALTSLTQSGFVGSPYYISPEQAMGETVDIRSDIYSLGIVMYEALSGKLPFEAKSPWSIVSQHIAARPPALYLNNLALPEDVERLVNKALAKRPEDRFQTPTEMLQAIQSILASEETPTKSKQAAQNDVASETARLYRQGLEAVHNEDWQLAVDLFSQVLQQRPDYKDIAEKLTWVSQQAKLAALYAAALRAMEAERWKEAIEELSEIVAIDAGYKKAADLLAKASESFSESKTHNQVALLYDQAMQHYQAGEWAEAAALFAQVYDIDPDYEQVAELLAESQRRTQATTGQKATSWLERGLAVFRGGEGNHRSLTVVSAAILVVLALMAIIYASYGAQPASPDSVKADYQQALQYMEQGQWTAAIEALDRVLAADPNYGDAAAQRAKAVEKKKLADMYQTATAYYQQGQWPEAISQLEVLRDRDPTFNQSSVENMLCTAYREQGLATLAKAFADHSTAALDEAAVAFDRGLAICPNDSALTQEKRLLDSYQEALAHVAAGDWDQALISLEAIYGERPNYGQGKVAELLYQTYIHTGDAYRDGGDLRQALAYYEQALEVDVADKSEAESRRDAVQRQLAMAPTATVTASPSPSPSATARPASTGPTRAAPAGRIVFPVFDPGRRTYDLYIANADGSERRKLVSEASQPDANAEGTEIVYRSWADAKKGLWVRQIDGAEIWNITSHSEAARPQCCYHGSYVYYTREGPNRRALIYRTTDGPNPQGLRQISNNNVIEGQSVSWLPDGRVVYQGCVGGACGLWTTTDANNPTAIQRLTDNPDDTAPAAYGSSVVFMSRRNGDWDIYRINVDTGEIKQLTTDEADDGLPTWSPDGRTIAFLSQRDGEWAVWAMNPDGSNQHRLFDLGGSPDGRVHNAQSYETGGWTEESIAWLP